MPEPHNSEDLRLCYLDGTCLSIQAAGKVTIEDLQTRNHPNALPFTGTLLIVDQPSQKPPQGADGHLIHVPKTVAKRLLPTLVGMGINYAPDRHEPQKKIGVISRAWFKGDEVKVGGIIYAKDFPEEAKSIKANHPRLGMSMELADIYVADKDSRVWKLKDFKFTGGAILNRDAAAYQKTSLAAAKEKFYVKSLAAAAAVLENNSTEKGGAHMPGQKKTSSSTSRSAGGTKLETRLAAAVSAGVSANLSDLIDRIDERMEKSDKILRLMARHMVEEAKAKGNGNGNGKGVKAKGKTIPDPSNPSDPSDMSAAAEDASLEAAEEDELTAALEGEEEGDKKTVQARKKSDDSTDDDDDDDDDEDASELESRADPSGDSSDPTYDHKTGVQAEFDEGSPHGSDENEDPSTGGVNKGAIKKFRKNSKRHLHASADVIKELQAAEDRIASLEEHNRKQEKKLKKQGRVIEAMQAHNERLAEVTNRHTVTPEVITLLSKEGFDVDEMRAQGQKLTVEQVDAVLGADPKLGLDPVTKTHIKNVLMQNGLMHDGEIKRFA
jgi:hypothetical protein